MEKITKRSQKEMNITREMVYDSFENLEIPEHKFLGRTSEGLVYENGEGLSVVLRVVAKQLDFLAEEEIEDFDMKAQAKIDKENLKAKKVAKAKAKKETKVETEVE